MTKQIAWSENVIRDGFTQQGYIEEVVGLHGAMRFGFRPMLPEDVEKFEAFRDRYGSSDPVRVRKGLAEQVTKRLVTWSEKSGDDELPITLDNVRHLRFTIQTKLYNVISGLVPTQFEGRQGEDDSYAEFGNDSDLDAMESLTETTSERVGK